MTEHERRLLVRTAEVTAHLAFNMGHIGWQRELIQLRSDVTTPEAPLSVGYRAPTPLQLRILPKDKDLADWAIGSTVMADYQRHRVALWIATMRAAQVASGDALDALASQVGLERQQSLSCPPESDAQFRKRLTSALLG